MAHPKNTLSLTKFMRSIECDLKIGYDWSAASATKPRIAFTIWQDGLSGEHYTLWNKRSNKTIKSGAKRLIEHINLALQGKAEILGVLCHGTIDAQGKKHRAYFDEQSLMVLELSDEPDRVVARIVGEISTVDIQANRASVALRMRLSALEDLDQVPEGCESPQKNSKSVEVFKRDAMVRIYVKRRAKGCCEFCGTRGFILPNGSNYLEVHHVLGLSDDGPDTIANVIGLCAEHHREAHYGKHSKRLNIKLRKILATIGASDG